jgi:hypothetical protein
MFGGRAANILSYDCGWRWGLFHYRNVKEKKGNFAPFVTWYYVVKPGALLLHASPNILWYKYIQVHFCKLRSTSSMLLEIFVRNFFCHSAQLCFE